MDMPFGRHYGLPVNDLPDAYLAWLLTIDLREPLRAVVIAEAELRGLLLHPAPPTAPLRDVAEQLVTAGLHALARRHHPDLGGDLATMQDLNAAADWLRGRVRKLA
jgi:hypothetical protein